MTSHIVALRLALAIALGLPLLAGCSKDTGMIDSEGKVFDRIEAEASLSLIGTEPFWSLVIEPDGERYTARYSTPETIDGTSFAATRFAGNNGLGFSGRLGEEPVQIAITPGKCSDGMSDRVYPFSASVRIGETLLEGCAETSDEPATGSEMP